MGIPSLVRRRLYIETIPWFSHSRCDRAEIVFAIIISICKYGSLSAWNISIWICVSNCAKWLLPKSLKTGYISRVLSDNEIALLEHVGFSSKSHKAIIGTDIINYLKYYTTPKQLFHWRIVTRKQDRSYRMAYFTKEVYPSSAEPPLKSTGGLPKLGLTSSA